MKNLFTICASLFLIPLFLTSSVAAQSLCPPVYDGTVLNLAYECLNDSTAMVVDSSMADNYGWQYSPESGWDGLTGSTVGGGTYEMYGMAFRETQDELWIVLSGNVPLEGFPTNLADDGIISWGDLFINISGSNFLSGDFDYDFLSHSDNQAFYAVRFSQSNNSGAALLGVYSGVDGQSVTSINHGLSTYQSFENNVFARGSVPDFGDFGDNLGSNYYYDRGISHNVINQSTYLDNFQFLTNQELADSGYNGSHLCAPDQGNGPPVCGTYTIGFKFNKGLIKDRCGVVGGDGTSCLDCAGIACGNTEVDDCGVCGGDNSTCTDCSGEVNGDAEVDQCGVCDGDGTSCLDCAGQPFGNAVYDDCGVCDGDNTSCMDCSGEVNGGAVFDQCGVCDGDNSTCTDCTGEINGDAEVDQCGVCDGDGTSCLDCADIPFGDTEIDECGVCGGDNSTCLDCAGTPNGTASLDRCGICDGDGSSCLGCVESLETYKYDECRVKLNKQLRNIINNLNTRKLSKKFKQKIRKLARAAYWEAMHQLEMLPPIVVQCTNADFCINLDVSSDALDQIKDSSGSLVKLNRQILRKVIKSYEGGICEGTKKQCVERIKKRKVLYRNKLRKVKEFFNELELIINGVQTFNSSC